MLKRGERVINNLVILLADSYDKFRVKSNFSLENKKYKSLIIVIFSILIISCCFFLYVILGENNKLEKYAIHSIFIFFGSLYLLNRVDDCFKKCNYRRRKKEYYKSINRFKEELRKEFKLDSKDKIEALIVECENTIEKLNKQNKFLVYVRSICKNIILPFSTFVIGTIINIDKLKEKITLGIIVKGMGIFVVLLIVTVIVIFSLNLVLDSVFIGQKQRVKELSIVLKDIKIKNYT